MLEVGSCENPPGLAEAGSGLPKAGAGLPKAGSGLSEAGSAGRSHDALEGYYKYNLQVCTKVAYL